MFNSLPQEIREFPFDVSVTQMQAINKFKGILDEYLTTIPDEPNIGSKYSSVISGISMTGDRTNSIARITNI